VFALEERISGLSVRASWSHRSAAVAVLAAHPLVAPPKPR